MKKLTLLLVVTVSSILYFDLADTTNNLYINPVSFLGFVTVAWLSLGVYKLVKKLNQIKWIK